eukprot:15313-Eustigmatos_ZCMA.PRE.1
MAFLENAVRNGKDVVPYSITQIDGDPFSGLDPLTLGHQLIFVDLTFSGSLDILGSGDTFLENKGTRYAPNFVARPVGNLAAAQFIS